MRFVAFIALLAVCLSGSIALADIASPPAAVAPVKIVPVTISPALQSAINREQLRLSPKLTTDQRTKLTTTSKSTRSSFMTALGQSKSLTPTSVLTTSRKAIADAGVDLSNMTIEDAIMLMMAMIAEDARQDLRDQLEEMDATRKKRAALREQLATMKDATTDMKKDLQAQYDRLTAQETLATTRASNARELHAKVTSALASLPKLALPDGGPPQ